ncbi:hypothetical protein SAMN04489726_4639 [Allokutzneria albata]|uniref:Uncharacterized protein n=1 Tax=Allokutzneria albata TaxID=211114 RepID=A0A1G9Y712_ALLAB|nr:hypothetical protein SAMN04489726_4639 [Allokutzneria albata]
MGLWNSRETLTLAMLYWSIKMPTVLIKAWEGQYCNSDHSA